MERVHATCVALPRGEHWHAILLRGRSGSGKSDLALRLIRDGARLVADDQVELAIEDCVLLARAPASISGRMEVRGLGLVEMPAMQAVPLAMVFDLCAPADVPRMPEAVTATIAGRAFPCLKLAPFEVSAVAKVALGLDAALQGILGSGTPTDF